MFNKKYKKGMADAAKAYEAFGQKQADAIKHILEEVRQGKRDLEPVLRELNGNMDGLYDYIDSKEKAHLYTVYTPFDIHALDQQARLFLVGALYRLTMDKAPNEDQQNYLRAVQKYLEVKEPPFGVDPEAVENIEDIPAQKAILQTVLEYLCLQDGDSYDETEYQQEFLDAFSVNAKGRKEIMDHIDLLYTATGAKGLAEKYGYVPEEEEEPEETTAQEDTPHITSQNTDPEFIELKSDYADNAVKSVSPLFSCTETRSYCFLLPSNKCIKKQDGSLFSFNHLPDVGIGEIYKVDSIPDVVVIRSYDSNREVYAVGLFNLEKDHYIEIDHSKDRLYLLCTQGQYIVYGNKENNDIFVYDISNKEVFTIPRPAQNVSSKGYDMIAGIAGTHLYLSVSANQNNSNLYKVDLTSADLTAQLVHGFTIPRISPGIMRICRDQLYLIDYDEGDMFDNEHLQIFKGDIKNKTVETLVSIIGSRSSEKQISPSVNNISEQYITYRIENGKICLLELETGKKQEVVPHSKTRSRTRLPFFAVNYADFSTRLNHFPILGKWMYFEKENDSHIYKINIEQPGRVSILNP